MTLPIFVPYTHVREATRVFLAYQRNNPIHFIDVSGDKWSYLNYFAARWDEGLDFINIEHDIVPWPGAIEELESCPEQWCFFGYLPGIDCVADRCALFGLVKFGAKLIAAVPDVWKEMREVYANHEHPWRDCDRFMFRFTAEGRGIIPHQHYPAVLNANPQPNGSYFPLVEPLVTEIVVWRDLKPISRVEVRGDAQFSARAAQDYRVTINKMAGSKCCTKCGDFYTFDDGGRRHCALCGFYPDGFPLG